jgi:hypothetical protein
VSAYEIKTYVGNQTNVTLEEVVWSGRYAHLGIRGNQYAEGREEGATVAEWNLITEGFGVEGGFGWGEGRGRELVRQEL